MLNNQLVMLKLHSYLTGAIKGNQPLTINGATLVEVMIGNAEYYLSADNGRLFPRECAHNPEPINCTSNFVLDITRYGYSSFSDIVNNETTIAKIYLVAKGTVQRGINDIIFSSNSDGCHFGKNYTMAQSLSTNLGHFLSDSSCFVEKGAVSADLSLVGLYGGMPSSRSFLNALQECEFFRIEQRTIGELVNHLLGAASSSMSKVAAYLLPDVIECAFSMGNMRQEYNLEELPDLSYNHTLGLTDLKDDHNNNSTNPYALTIAIMGTGAAVVGISMTIGYWLGLGKRARHEMESKEEDIDSLSIASSESTLLGGDNNNIMIESEM